jgi:hypothetical protein
MERPRHAVYVPQEWQIHHHAARRQLKNGVRALRYTCAAIVQGRQRRQRCYRIVTGVQAAAAKLSLCTCKHIIAHHLPRQGEVLVTGTCICHQNLSLCCR